MAKRGSGKVRVGKSVRRRGTRGGVSVGKTGRGRVAGANSGKMRVSGIFGRTMVAGRGGGRSPGGVP